MKMLTFLKRKDMKITSMSGGGREKGTTKNNIVYKRQRALIPKWLIYTYVYMYNEEHAIHYVRPVLDNLFI